MPATAQPAANATAAASYSERITPLAGLVGEWRGSGWILRPSGSRETFTSHESVTPRISGNALLVEGRHQNSAGVLVHDAIALLVWDQRAGGYRMRTQLATGMGGDFPLEVRPGGFTWRIETPGGRIEYVAEFTADTWTERGRQIAPDGRTTDFFEMNLQRAR
ncbi:MAG TPA: hypothetical protein VGC46_08415 [Allosphingosinicella sp.]